MIAIDTNILVHAHRAESPWHEAAARSLRMVAEQRWAIPWPCLHEFIAVSTHPRIFNPPRPLKDAMTAVSTWMSAPTLTVLSETDGYWEILSKLLRTGRIAGPQVHDARVVALCLQHAVTELWTADRDFSRFPQVPTRNPLTGGG
jgi:toxin-antitoxin system PIN domain toxin